MPLLNGARVVVVRSHPFMAADRRFETSAHALRWLSRCASIHRWGRTTTYFSEGEERWSTSLGLIFKQSRT